MAVLLTLLLQTTPGLLGEYWRETTDPTGAGPVVPNRAADDTFTHATVDFKDATFPAPYDAAEGETFIARYSGYVRGPVTGPVTFRTVTDDGAHLTVDGQVLVNDWQLQGDTNNDGVFNMTQDVWYPITFLMYENTGGHTARLQWSYAGQTAFIPIPNTHTSVTPPPPPPTPSISASQGANFSTDINVSWTDSGAGATYTLQRSDGGGAFVTVGGTMTGLAYTDTNRAYGTTYCYQVRATSSGQNSAFSSPVACVTLALPPPRTAGDNSEGFFEDNCSCGASTSPQGAVFAVLAALFAGALRRRRPAVH